MQAATARRAEHHTSVDYAEQVLPYRAELLRAALRYTRSAADADDLVQDVLARALSAWPGFRTGTNCRGWLHAILTNTFISGYRGRQRRRDREDVARSALYEGDCEAADLTDGSFDDEVVAALAGLDPDQLAAVTMVDVQGRAYRDVSAALGVPMGTLMSRLHRARRRLRVDLREYAAARGIGR
jgi:RNA polymerase sigma-70 factor (ECF subfamily)